jgi:hypothetical protein
MQDFHDLEPVPPGLAWRNLLPVLLNDVDPTPKPIKRVGLFHVQRAQDGDFMSPYRLPLACLELSQHTCFFWP